MAGESFLKCFKLLHYEVCFNIFPGIWWGKKLQDVFAAVFVVGRDTGNN